MTRRRLLRSLAVALFAAPWLPSLARASGPGPIEGVSIGPDFYSFQKYETFGELIDAINRDGRCHARELT